MSSDLALDIAARWTAMWNGELMAEAVATRDCAVYFGRMPPIERAASTHGPWELQVVVNAIRESLPGVRYGFDSPPLLQGRAGVVTLLWRVEAPGHPLRNGIDLLRHDRGLVCEVWSIAGDLPLPALAA